MRLLSRLAGPVVRRPVLQQQISTNQSSQSPRAEMPDYINCRKLYRSGYSALYRSFLVEAARVSLGCSTKRKPDLYNIQHFRSNPFTTGICINNNDSVLLTQLQDKFKEYDEVIINFPSKIFDIESASLIDPSGRTVQDFPLPRSINNHIFRPSKLYYETNPQSLISGLELKISGRDSSRRSRSMFYTTGRFDRRYFKSKIDFARSVRILRTGSLGIKVTLKYAD